MGYQFIDVNMKMIIFKNDANFARGRIELKTGYQVL
jgi:hypothetical protein